MRIARSPSGFAVFALVATLLAAGLQAGEAQETRSYRHPAGFSVQYPASWQIQESLEGIVLLPEDARRDAAGNPLEFFLLGSDQAPGITDPADPTVVAYFQSSMPGFNTVGSPERVETAMGPGAVLTFQGSLGGPPLRQRTYVALRDGVGVFLAHLATRDIAATRDAEALRIFESFSWGEGERDQRLVGAWTQGSSTYSDGGVGVSSSGSESSYQLHPDGTAVYSWESSISVDVEGASAFSNSADQQRGTWVAGAGVLYLRFESGDEHEYQYELVPMGDGSVVLQLTDAEGEKSNYHRSG